jgi:hypothetical protein
MCTPDSPKHLGVLTCVFLPCGEYKSERKASLINLVPRHSGPERIADEILYFLGNEWKSSHIHLSALVGFERRKEIKVKIIVHF